MLQRLLALSPAWVKHEPASASQEPLRFLLCLLLLLFLRLNWRRWNIFEVYAGECDARAHRDWCSRSWECSSPPTLSMPSLEDRGAYLQQPTHVCSYYRNCSSKDGPCAKAPSQSPKTPEPSEDRQFLRGVSECHTYTSCCALTCVYTLINIHAHTCKLIHTQTHIHTHTLMFFNYLSLCLLLMFSFHCCLSDGFVLWDRITLRIDKSDRPSTWALPASASSAVVTGVVTSFLVLV